jgi:hypothetical protein
MKYRPKSIAALQIALGGLPDKMRVQADPGIRVSADSRRASEGNSVARELGHSSPTGPSRKRGNGEQGDRRNSILAKVVARIPAAEHNNGRQKVTTIFSSPGGIGLYGENIFSRAARNRPDIVLEGVKRHISLGFFPNAG